MKGFEPMQCAGGIGCCAGVQAGYIRPGRAGGHDDGDAEHPRREQFGLRGCAAGVFGYDDFDAFVGQHLTVRNLREGAARGDDFGARGQGFGRGGVDAADDVVMPGDGGEGGEVFAADGQENPAWRAAQSGGGMGHVRYFGPAVAFRCLPGGAFDQQEGGFCLADGDDGVLTHPRGEGVRGDDERLYIVFKQVSGKARDAAEAAAAPWDIRQTRCGGAARQRERGGEARVVRQEIGQGGGFAGAAEDEDF